MLIDLDASCRLGDRAGQKVTSSACFPPEMAQRSLLEMTSMSEFYAEQQDEPDLASFYDGQTIVVAMEAGRGVERDVFTEVVQQPVLWLW